MKEKTQKKKPAFRLVLRFLKGSKAMFAASMIFAVLIALADMLDPQVIRIAVDNVILGNPGEYSAAVMNIVNSLGGFEYLHSHIWIVAGIVLAVAVLRVVSQYLFRVCNTRATETFVKTTRDSLFEHIEKLPFAWHMKNHTGDIIQRCTSDIETMRNFVSEQLTNVFRIVVLIVMSMVFMLSMNVRLALISFIPIPFVLYYAIKFHNKIGEGFMDCDENEGKLSAMAQENLTGVRVVRAFGREKSERDRFEQQNAYYTGLWEKLAAVLSSYWATQDIISGVQMLIVVSAGAVFCTRDMMSAGEYIAFISYNATLTWPVRMLGRMISEMSKAGVSLERISYIMDSEEEKEPENALTPPLNGDICFDHVSFAYENGPEILHDICFTMKAGTTLGILGGTGSGKSTLMLLLDKLYELPEDCGTISIGGTDIRKISNAYLRENIGMVLQEPFMFSRTIAENIGIAEDDIGMDRIRAAASAACLDETVMSFAKGYDTFVGERGVTLSGGQKQRAAIARALTGNKPVMIFDDSLSAVDTETDAAIRTSLEKLFGTAGIILISHRISTLSKADKIIVLDDGRIVQEGTPEELAAQDGIYRRIYSIQSLSDEEVSA